MEEKVGIHQRYLQLETDIATIIPRRQSKFLRVKRIHINCTLAVQIANTFNGMNVLQMKR